MDYKKMYEESQEALEELQDKYDTLDSAVENNYMTIEEHNEYYSEWKDKAERCDELEEELEQAQKENKKWKGKYEVMFETNKKLHQKYKKWKDKYHHLEEDYSQLFNKFDALEEENTKTEKKFIDTNKIVNAFCSDLSKKGATFDDLFGNILGYLYNGWSFDDAIDPKNLKCNQTKEDDEFEYVGRGDETLDRWVKQNYGEDMDWEFDVRKERRGEYCHAKVGDDYGDWEIGIVIVPKEKEECPHGIGGGFQLDIGECECGGHFDECKTCGDKYKCQHCGLCNGTGMTNEIDE